MRDDISKAIPNSGFDGPAVIDWEEWRPLWSMNWGKKKVYKKLSEEYARNRYPHLSKKSARLRAVTEFNKAARLSDLRDHSGTGCVGRPQRVTLVHSLEI